MEIKYTETWTETRTHAYTRYGKEFRAESKEIRFGNDEKKIEFNAKKKR